MYSSTPKGPLQHKLRSLGESGGDLQPSCNGINQLRNWENEISAAWRGLANWPPPPDDAFGRAAEHAKSDGHCSGPWRSAAYSCTNELSIASPNVSPMIEEAINAVRPLSLSRRSKASDLYVANFASANCQNAKKQQYNGMTCRNVSTAVQPLIGCNASLALPIPADPITLVVTSPARIAKALSVKYW